jgi:hypothetical protein
VAQGTLQGALHRLGGDVQHRGHLVGAEIQDVAQDEHRDLPGREGLQGGDEGQGDRLAALVTRLRVEQGVREGLQPDDLAEAARLGRLDAGHVPLPLPAPALGAARVQAAVGRDPVQPRPRRGPLGETGEALPCGQHRVLQSVLGVLQRPEHPVAVHPQLTPVRLGQLPERVAVPGARPRDHVIHLKHLRTDTGRAANGAPPFDESRCLHQWHSTAL